MEQPPILHDAGHCCAAALQHLYGANYSYNAGDTRYTWSTTTGETLIDGVRQGVPGGGVAGANRVFLTIWDGFGRDTYDMSNYTNGVSIDLRPGRWSVASPAQHAVLDQDPATGTNILARGNVYNALLHDDDPRSLIENAVGGAGDDTIRGNDADNVLVGKDGCDTFFGSGGADVYNGGAGFDQVAFDFAGSDAMIMRFCKGAFSVVANTSHSEDIAYLFGIERLTFSDGEQVLL
jgi:serralysin